MVSSIEISKQFFCNLSDFLKKCKQFTNLSDQKTKLPKVVPRRPYTMYFEFFAEDFNKNFYIYNTTQTTYKQQQQATTLSN